MRDAIAQVSALIASRYRTWWGALHPAFWVALLFCLAGRIYLSLALGLSVDEAHYALYAAHPALSYFDHPPLVGWLQMPFLWLGGSDGLMRAAPLALWAATAGLLWRCAQWLSVPAAPVWTLVLFLLSPMHHLLGLALVPDTLLLPLTLWVMELTWKLASAPASQAATLRLWLWLGVALGLSGLAKYTGIFLAMSAATVLLASHGWSLFKARGLWLAAMIALVMISPVLVWNAQHGWISFTYQLGHAGGNPDWQWRRVFLFELVQLLSYGTLPLVGLLVFLRSLSIRQSQAQKAPEGQRRLMFLCLAFAAPTLLLGMYSSGKGSALPHWSATGWLALLPLSAMGLQQLWHRRSALGTGYARQAARVLVCTLGTLQALSLLALGLLMSAAGQGKGPVQGSSLLGSTGNPFADLHDWQAAAQQAQTLQTEHHADALAVSNWTLASRLAWYARPAKVLALDGKNKQFELWFGALEYGQHYIWLDWSQMPLQAPVGCHLLQAQRYQGQYSQFDFYLCGRP